jgi:sterol desaturase/sphingolipid hydroxylase (fatty acid hydroxylase superfamily)
VVAVPSFIHLALRPESRKPAPDPVPVSMRPVFLVGIGAWLVALVVALVLWLTDAAGPHGVWACVTGAALGAVGLAWTRRRPGR